MKDITFQSTKKDEITILRLEELFDDDFENHYRVVNRLHEILSILVGSTGGYESSQDSFAPIKVTKVLGHITQLSNSVTNVLFPNARLYGSVEFSPEKQSIAAAVATVLNKSAQTFQHRLAYSSLIFDGLAYNRGVVSTEYEILYSSWGTGGGRNPSDLTLSTSSRVFRQGNNVDRLDPWNVILDPDADPNDYRVTARKTAVVSRMSSYQVYQLAEAGEIIIPVKMKASLAEDSMTGVTDGDSKYSRHLSVTPQIEVTHRHGKKFDWKVEFGDGCETIPTDMCLSSKSLPKHEIVTYYIKAPLAALNYTIRGVDKSEMRTWKIRVLNGKHVVSVDEASNGHGFMPFCVFTPRQELDLSEGQSFAEILAPYQKGSSKLFNDFLHQIKIGLHKGITFVSNSIPTMDKSDMTSGHVRVDLPKGTRIGDHVYNVPGPGISDYPLIGQNRIEQAMQTQVPTDAISQMANLERPVTHQSRSIMASVNLPVLTLARTAHAQVILPLLEMMVADLAQTNTPVEITDPESGHPIAVGPDEYSEAIDPLSLSDGLRGLDAIAVGDRIQTMIQYMLQSPEASRDFDVMAMISYLLQLEGSSISMSAFRKTDEFSQLDPEMKQAAVQLLQQAMEEQQAYQDPEQT